jgi:predicted DNA-binding transcriptional regulator AlpA
MMTMPRPFSKSWPCIARRPFLARRGAVYQDERQLIKPREALLALNIPRASFYALLKRGAFPRPLLINDAWAGWPREIVLEWADPSARERLEAAPSSGHAPFER